MTAILIPLGVWAIISGLVSRQQKEHYATFLIALGVATLAHGVVIITPFPAEPLTTLPAILFAFIKLNIGLPVAIAWFFYAYLSALK